MRNKGLAGLHKYDNCRASLLHLLYSYVAVHCNGLERIQQRVGESKILVSAVMADFSPLDSLEGFSTKGGQRGTRRSLKKRKVCYLEETDYDDDASEAPSPTTNDSPAEIE